MKDRWIQGLENLPPAVRGCVLTIGNFDGVHRGHQAILSLARREADRAGAGVAAMTFDPPPDLVLRPVDEPRLLTPPARKAELLLQAGADWAVTTRATTELLRASPEQFLQSVVMDYFSPVAMVEGEDFSFGKARAGNVEFLRRFGLEHGFTVQVVPAVAVTLGGQSQRISSTLVRGLIADGAVEQARECLGRPFALVGPVVAGFGRGRNLDYPTANLDPARQVVPADGVYAALARLGGSEYLAAVSVGNQPTFPSGKHAVEAFLLDATGDFYGLEMTLEFRHRLRPQRRFETVEALKAQMNEDVQRVRDLLEERV
ncbi:MAG: bifunctional riboflavin kinase/FAD synthetase [Planctomycetota bacterium]|nr:bifunctional riboflavin kinase/FAD synthetase [Planctomycetota bacterium]